MSQKWYQKASVQTALVSGVFLLVGISIPYVFKVPKLKEAVSRLQRETSDKTARIQELEIELTPFRTLAIKEYSRSDAETLRRLAETMVGLRKDYSEALATVTSLQTELESLQAKMAPRSLTLEQQSSLQDRLKAFSGQRFTVLTYQDDQETLSLSNMIYRVLLSSGWSYVNTRQFLGFFLITGVEVGVAPSRAQDFGGAADALAFALSMQGIAASVKTEQEQDKTHPDLIVVRVGKKPSMSEGQPSK